MLKTGTDLDGGGGIEGLELKCPACMSLPLLPPSWTRRGGGGGGGGGGTRHGVCSVVCGPKAVAVCGDGESGGGTPSATTPCPKPDFDNSAGVVRRVAVTLPKMIGVSVLMPPPLLLALLPCGDTVSGQRSS
jgi:hypothetical protein